MPDVSDEAKPELRREPLTGEYVIIAPARGQRPHSRPDRPGEPALPAYDPKCPLCPGNESETPPAVLTLPEDAAEWSLRVVPNRYPFVASKSGGGSGADGIATGAQEVLIETPRHDLDLPDRDADSVALMLEALRRRLLALQARSATRYVIAFKNKGREAGTSLDHPHSQIVALDFLPPQVRRRVALARRFHRRTGRCYFCSLIEDERRARLRFVFEEGGFVALTPFASANAGEVLLVPVEHATSFSASAGELRGQARALKRLVGRCRAAFDDPAYNLMLHDAPVRAQADPAVHWYWRLSPRRTIAAGFELGSGVRINSLAPEQAAVMLRGH